MIEQQKPTAIRTCTTCGLAQRVPPLKRRTLARCTRCHTTLLSHTKIIGRNRASGAFAVAALILYPLAICLPIVRVERFGFGHDDSLLSGIAVLFGRGDLFVGSVVLIFSIIIPLGKLFGLLILSAGGASLGHKHRALTYHLIEWTGRWGMLDVLLVAVLVASVKIGDLVEVTLGPGSLAFGTCVLLSLIASAVFNPHMLWSSRLTNALPSRTTS